MSVSINQSNSAHWSRSNATGKGRTRFIVNEGLAPDLVKLSNFPMNVKVSSDVSWYPYVGL